MVDSTPTGRCVRGELIVCAELAHERMKTVHPHEQERGRVEVTSLCERGLAIACAYLGDGQLVSNPAAARLSYERGCTLGAPLACSSLGITLDNETPGSPRAHELLVKACDAGSPEGCTWLAHTMRPKTWTEEDVGSYWSLITRGCMGKAPVACRLLGKRELEGDGIPSDAVAAAEHFRAACEGHDGEGCRYWGHALEHGAGTTKDERSAVRAFGTSCDEGDRAGCLRLASAYAHGTGVSKDVAHAAELLTAGCSRGDRPSCGRLASDGGIESDRKKRLESLGKLCTTDNPMACEVLGETLFWVDPDEGPRARELLERTCAAKVPDACLYGYAATTALQRKLKRKGAVPHALEFLERGCDGKTASEGCVELAEQLVSGEMVAKNPKRGAELAARLCASDGAACSTAGLTHEKGLGTPADPAKAVAAYRKGCEAKNAQACRELARLTRAGKGTTKNVDEANALERQAEELSD